MITVSALKRFRNHSTFTVFHFKGGPCKPFTKLFVVSIIGVIIIANVSVLIISTAQNDVIDIQLGRAHVSKIFPETIVFPLSQI